MEKAFNVISAGLDTSGLVLFATTAPETGASPMRSPAFADQLRDRSAWESGSPGCRETFRAGASSGPASAATRNRVRAPPVVSLRSGLMAGRTPLCQGRARPSDCEPMARARVPAGLE
jgi:hypothetical protein